MSQAPAPVESSRVTPYHGLLFVLLSTATFFDGFDVSMMSLASRDVSAGLGISQQSWGLIFSITRVGIVASFFLLLFADRFGRRLLMFVTVLGFGAVTGAHRAGPTMRSSSPRSRRRRASSSPAEYALAVIMIGEEFPARAARARDRDPAHRLRDVGVMVMAKLQPFVLLGPTARRRTGSTTRQSPACARSRARSGWSADGAPWRALYLLGLAAARADLRAALRHARDAPLRGGSRRAHEAQRRAELRRAVARGARAVPWRRATARRTAIVALLWNCVSW